MDPLGAARNLHDDQEGELTQQEREDVDHSPVGLVPRFDPRSRKLADRDPNLPIAYHAARWSAVALITTTTTLTAWWLVDAGAINWFINLFWEYLSWLPFVG